MLTVIVLGFLCTFAFKSTAITWKPLAAIFAIGVVATAHKTNTAIKNLALLGEDASYLRDPGVLIPNAAINIGFYLAFYLLAFGLGVLWRRKRG